LSVEFKAAICPSCGAKIHFPEESDRTQCTYCGVTVFIDRHESRVWIVEKPMNLPLFKKLAEKVTDTVGIYSISRLAELMAKCDNRVFPFPEHEVRRFVEWMNGKDDIMTIKWEEFDLDGRPIYFFRFLTRGKMFVVRCVKCGKEIMEPSQSEIEQWERYSRRCRDCYRKKPNRSILG